jgi:hypothetical protein
MDLCEAINALKAPGALFWNVRLRSFIAPAALRAGEVHRDLRSAGHPGNMRPESGICHTGSHNQTDALPMAKAENLASYTANSATQCRSNRSPIGVSQKREYFKYQPETIGDFALRLSK